MATSGIKYDDTLRIRGGTKDILSDALNVTSMAVYTGSGSSYTGSLPDAEYKYAVFVVFNRGSNLHVVGILAKMGIILNQRTNNAWSGWKTISAS